MKRILITAACMAALAATAYAGNAASKQIHFTYSQGAEQADRLNNAMPGESTIYLAAEFRPEDVAAYRHSLISAITVAGGTTTTEPYVNPVSDIEVFISRNLEEEPVMIQKATMRSEVWSVNSITLDTPYEISDDDQSLFIGFSFTAPENDNSFYVVHDNIPAVDSNLIYGISDTSALPAEWNYRGDSWGSLYIIWSMVGEELVDNKVVPTAISFPSYIPTGGTGSYVLKIHNEGAASVENVTIDTEVEGGHYSQTIELPKALAPMDYAEITVADIPFGGEGFIPLKATVAKVNGSDNTAGCELDGEATVYGEGYDRNFVVENATGFGCGWCPSSLVMCEYFEDEYPERIFPVLVHSSDEYAVSDADGFINDYVTGLPATWVNRNIFHQASNFTMDGNCEFADSVYQACIAAPAYCKIGVAATLDEQNNRVNVEATSEFCFDTEKKHLISFMLIEDNMGPHKQLNNYAGGVYGPMGGWELEPTRKTDTYSDNVLRALNAYPGLEGSLPASIRKGEQMVYESELSLENTISDELEVIAIITNAETGEIMNAAKVTPAASGVSEIGPDGMSIEAGNGFISVSGASEASVWSLDGTLIGSGSELRVSAAPGLYIVKVGNDARKVLVK